MQRDWNPTVALLSSLGARVVHQNSAHEPCGKAVEVFSIFKPQAALTDKLQEKLVNDAGWLKQVFRPLSAEQRTGDHPQLRINKLEKVLDGCGIACPPIAEEHCYFACIRQ
jgi:hypothetical protein